MIEALTGNFANSSTPATTGERAKLEQAATEFESLLLSQMLRSAREANSRENGGEDSGMSVDSIMEIAEQQIAKLLAAAGGLGLAKTVVEQTSLRDPSDLRRVGP